MSGDTGTMLWAIVAGIIAFVTVISLRRTPLGIVIRSLVAWAVIGVLLFVAVGHRDEIGGIVAGVTERLGIDDQQVEGETVRIRMSPDGHFWARVRLNGIERRMLVDSGATTTAISEETAAAAGIGATGGGFPVMIETANGTIAARHSRVDDVSVGPLSTRDLGVVVSENFGDMNVLGMNFLSRLKSWRVEGKVLVLEPNRSEESVPA